MADLELVPDEALAEADQLVPTEPDQTTNSINKELGQTTNSINKELDQTTQKEGEEEFTHEENKLLLTLLGITLGSVAIWIFN